MAKRFLLLVVVLLCVAEIASAGLITGIARRNPDGNSGDTEPQIGGPLVNGSLVFVDRTAATHGPGGHQYTDLPAYLVGADYVVVANDDKDNPNYELDVQVAGPATMYLLIDYRVGDNSNLDPAVIGAGKMDWAATMGFTATGDSVSIDENGDGDIDNWASVYVLPNVNGTITLFEQNDGGGRNMYGVAVTPEPATLALLGLGGLILRRRK